MEVSVAELAVKAMAGKLGRSNSKRLIISEEKCCASHAEPPLPQLRILCRASKQRDINVPACTRDSISVLAAAIFVCMLSLKCCLILCAKSMSVLYLKGIFNPHDIFFCRNPQHIKASVDFID